MYNICVIYNTNKDYQGIIIEIKILEFTHNYILNPELCIVTCLSHKTITFLLSSQLYCLSILTYNMILIIRHIQPL